MGILVNTGFDVGSSNPVDSRTVKNTTDERDALVTDGLVYENLKVYCKDTQTEYRWTGTDWEEVGTGGTVDLSGYAKTYTSLTELGLTADATIDNVISALKDGETAIITTNEFTNYLTMFPNYCTNDQYAILKVEKKNSNRCFIEWRQKEGNAYAIGGLNSSNKFTNWNNLVRFKKDGFADDSIVCIGDTVSSDGVIQTLDTLGFSNDILTWDTGVYRVSHVSGLTGLPSEITSVAPSFRLEHHDIKKWGANHNPNTQTWAQRHSVLYPEGGNVYHRFYESGATSGTYIKDTGWQKISCNKYYSINQLNSVKGTSIELVANTDNTLKIVEALGDGEEFVDWFGNTDNRFGLGTSVGTRINYLRIQKTNATNGIILAVTDYGKTFSRAYNAGTLENWCYDKTKATLVTNTATLKLDVTKKNSGWYGAIKLTYLYDTSPAEIEISFRAATEDLRWAVINGQKYIKKITFTQDSSNTAHYTIGIEFSGTTYGCYQAEVIGDFANINSLTSEAFTGAKTAVYYSPWGKNNGVTLVSAPEDIGLTFPCTTVQLAQAMRSKFNKAINAGAIGVFNCGGKATTITDAPADYGLLHIETFGYDRILIRFDGIGSSCYAGSWIGQIQSNNGTFSGITWERLNNDTRVTTLETQVSELFQSVSNGKSLVANAITGKGVSTSSTATFATMATNIGKITNYTASEKQALATAITNKGVSTSSTASFSTMATNIGKINSYKEETKSFPIPMSGSTTTTSTFSANVIGIKQIIAPTETSRVIPQTTLELFKIEGKNVTMTITGEGTWKVTALIKA